MAQQVMDGRGWDLFVSPWHLDEHLVAFPTPVGAVQLPGLPDSAADLPTRLSSRYGDVASAIGDSELPFVLAGDCLTALGCVVAAQRRHRDVSVIWLDAHGDFNTPEISASGYLAGMSLAMLTGHSPEPISKSIGLRPVPDDRVVLIGARDLDPAERDALAASRVLCVAAEPQAVSRALTQRPGADVYLHIDVDLIDGKDVPGLRWTTSAGPALAVVEECVSRIVNAAPPIAVSVACPWSTQRLRDESTRHVITRVAAAVGAPLRWGAEER